MLKPFSLSSVCYRSVADIVAAAAVGANSASAASVAKLVAGFNQFEDTKLTLQIQNSSSWS